MAANNFRTVYFALICVLVSHTANGSKNCSRLCTTRACVQLAAQFLSKINEDIDPCEEFYGFACGKYPEDTVMTRHGKNEITSQSTYKIMYDRMSQMIEDYVDKDRESIAYKRKVIYSSCMDFHNHHKELMKMKKQLSEYYIPNWPNIESAADVDDWLLNFHLANEFSFVRYDINYTGPELYQEYAENRGMTPPPNLSTSLEITVMIDLSSMFDFCSDTKEDQITDFIYGVIEDLEISSHASKKIVDDAIYMDHLLQNLTSTDYSEMNYNLDCKNISIVNRWCRMFERIVDRTQMEGNFSSTKFEFWRPGMFVLFNDLLNTVSSESISNYLAVHFILRNLVMLSHFTRNFLFPCKTSMSQWEEHAFLNRRMSCTYFITSYLPLFIVPEYISAKNIPQKLILLQSILKQLTNVTMELLDTSWMPENMKEAYLASLKQTTVDQLDYVPYILSSDPNIRYADLTADPESFFLNIDSIRRMNCIDNFRHYKRGLYFRTLMQLNPFTANAASGENINLGFGFYEIPYSGQSLPKFVDYARFGFPLSHEITHNIHYIILSNSENSTKSFEDYERCVADMYSKFSLPMLKVPAKGNRTFAENFADLLGKQIAYEAYLNFVSQHGEEPRLPGLSSFSGKQLFFMLSAQDWCEFGMDYKSYLKNPHSPSEHRIRGPSMNLESFSNIFDCKEGSPMNPVKKCHLN